MAVNEQSVATDLGKLLRESLSDEVELVAKSTASIPVQLAPAPSTFPTAPSQHPASGIQMAGAHQTPHASIPPLGPQLATLPTPMKPMKPLSLQAGVPVSPPKTSSRAGLIVGAFVGVALLAGAGGGGFAWYRAKHHVAAPVAKVASPPVVTTPAATALAAPAAPEPSAPAEKEATPDPAPPPTAEATPAAEPVADPAPVATHHHHAAPPGTTAPPATPSPVAAAPPPPPAKPDPVAAAPAPKPAAPPPAAPPPAAPAPKPGGVDALLQQQLSGAIP